MRRYSLLLFCCILSFSGYAQEVAPPLRIPLQLSGNFGELRPNHFHSGIDFKTEQAIDKPVIAVNDGYISRIAVNRLGYGKVLYIDHPGGYTTVYAHLQRFSPVIEKYVYRQQMEQQAYLIDIKVPQDSLPVKKGSEIARSGNTGSSGGPHLHFEVRDTESEHVLDALDFYREQIKDTRPPVVRSVKLFPVNKQGIIDSAVNEKTFSVTALSPGTFRVTLPVRAWGRIGIALKCHDLMDGTSNIYGVKKVRLFVDSVLLFNSAIDRFSFDETRYINSLIDYGEWINKNGFYQKCYLDPGNRLSFVNAVNRGIISIDEERTYQISVELEDGYSNRSVLKMEIEGKPQDIVAEEPPCENLFSWRTANRFREKGIDLELPRGAIYDSFCFDYQADDEGNPLAGTHYLHNDRTVLHSWCRLSLKLKEDPLENKAQYGIERQTPKGSAWIGGSYKQGWIEGEIREFGIYTIGIDSIPPKITPVGTPQQWSAKKTVELRLSDDDSGIDNFKTYIDGEFVLFEVDKRYTIRTGLSRVARTGKLRELTIEVSDKCGNVSDYKEKFIW